MESNLNLNTISPEKNIIQLNQNYIFQSPDIPKNIESLNYNYILDLKSEREKIKLLTCSADSKIKNRKESFCELKQYLQSFTSQNLVDNEQMKTKEMN